MTVDAAQGCEADYVIISAVRSNPGCAIGHVANERRVNVALSRCRKRVIVVGNSQTLVRPGAPWQMWSAVKALADSLRDASGDLPYGLHSVGGRSKGCHANAHSQRGRVAPPMHTTSAPGSAASVNPVTEQESTGAGESQQLPSAGSGVQQATVAGIYARANGPTPYYLLEGAPRQGAGVLSRIMAGSHGVETSQSHFQEPSPTLVAVLNQMLEADCRQRA